MSDMGDMTIEMMRRLSNTLHELSPEDLSKLKGLCMDVSSKIDTISSSKAASPKAKAAAPPAVPATSAKPAAFLRAISTLSTNADEHDAYFGVDDGPIDESGEPIVKGAAPKEQPKAKAAPAPVKQAPPPVVAQKTSQQQAPAQTQAKKQAMKAPEAPKAPAQSKPKTPIETPITANRFSKYLPDERPVFDKELATDEALCDEDTWNAEYVKVFGKPPNNDPLTDVEALNAPRGGPKDPRDAFAKVREVQANAARYPTPQEYYDALTAAMQEWKNQRLATGQLIGSVTSDRYISQLANSAPDSANYQAFGTAKKFTFDAMFNEIAAEDEDGNPSTVLQFTQVLLSLKTKHMWHSKPV
jgi:hypothetical protein